METMIRVFVMFSLVIACATGPFFSKKDIYFGVRIPSIDGNKLRKIRIKFILLNSIVGIIGTYLMLIISNPLIGIVGVTFGYLGVAILVYTLAYKEVKDLKSEMLQQKSHINRRHITVIDTSFTKEKGKKMLISSKYFLIPLGIALLMIMIPVMNYDKIPNPMPMHYNAAGEVDGWANKTYGTVLMLPMVSLAMTGLFYFIYRMVGMSKQQISVKNPRLSSQQSRIYRKIWSAYTVGSATLMNMLFGYIQLNLFREPVEKAGEMMFVTLGFTLIMVISALAIGFYAGNGGSKLKVKEESMEGAQDTPNSIEEESEDDQYWKWGMLYYNPNDPSVFVEKRIGIGWTVNMGTLQGKLYLVGMLIFTIAVIVISIMNS